ncbi:ent-kaurene oxidase, chloroplastic-like [Olea europaea subsp. europaea]|uniref:Ent-kaurene oxidase, chloroplastic-like n=1 Tax=Olea europaea subsp. europaea TaxID=158383 RepID=A0A8S0UXU9_OLEEU|nr:ent-kaurene oxidase, chloroplastic-like [Olea europaea subsp. europaea]
MKVLTNEQRRRTDCGKELNCYIDYLLSKAKMLSEQQILMLLQEAIIETLLTTEWAMYELAKLQRNRWIAE